MLVIIATYLFSLMTDFPETSHYVVKELGTAQ
jgi:hypothetical protein